MKTNDKDEVNRKRLHMIDFNSEIDNIISRLSARITEREKLMNKSKLMKLQLKKPLNYRKLKF